MTLILLVRNGGCRTYPLTGGGPWRIGRKAPSEILVKDKRISAVHAELALTPGGALLRRMEGFNPIRVDGREVESIALQVGAAFTIGDTTFSLVDSNASKAASGASQIDSREVFANAAACGFASGTQRVSAVQFIREISRITAIPGEDDLNRAILHWVCEKLGAQRSVMTRTAADGGQIVVATTGFDAVVEIQDLISTTVLRRVLDDLHTVFISDLSANASFGGQQSVVANGICAVACAPLLDSDSKVAGIIYVDNRGLKGRFEREDAEFLLWAGQFYQLFSETIRLRQRLEVQLIELKRTAEKDLQIIAESNAILDVLAIANRIAPSDGNVLILGETGSGKECIADFIHRQSPRAKGPFIVRNCAAIPKDLFESELFGHEEGSFTGAKSELAGAFEEAAGGTLFLDEIGDLEYSLQAKLLRAVQSKRIRRVGGKREFAVNVRIICATNRDLNSAMKAKDFRDDLFFRISTFTLEVPPLRDRRDDIVPLARHFTKQLSGAERTLTPEAEARLKAFDWPGNIRQLRCVIERAVCMASGTVIQSKELSLPNWKRLQIASSGAARTLADAERQHIVNVMNQVNGNVTHAAETLDIARSTLVAKLKAFGIS